MMLEAKFASPAARFYLDLIAQLSHLYFLEYRVSGDDLRSAIQQGPHHYRVDAGSVVLQNRHPALSASYSEFCSTFPPSDPTQPLFTIPGGPPFRRPSGTFCRRHRHQTSYEGRDSFSKELAQVLYEYYDLYNRGLVKFGGTLATGLVDVNPGAAAVRPVTMAARIAPYLRYYATRRPLDDHGVVPLVLVSSTTTWLRSLPVGGGVAAGGPRRGRLKGPVRVRTDATDADWLPTLICQRLPRMPGPIRAGFVDGTRVEARAPVLRGMYLLQSVPAPLAS